LKRNESIANFDQMYHTIETIAGQDEKIACIHFAKALKEIDKQ
jgi:hypothetical protein